MSKKPTPKQISRVMSELGRRNKGKPKKLTPAGIAQRRKAGKASARLRKAAAMARKHVGSPMPFRLRSPAIPGRHTPENIAPLAQTKKRHHYDAPDGFPCSCGKPIDDFIHLPRVEL